MWKKKKIKSINKISIKCFIAFTIFGINCLSCSYSYYFKKEISLIDELSEHCMNPDILDNVIEQLKERKKIKCNFFLIYVPIGDYKIESCVGLFQLFSRDCKKNKRYYIPILKFSDKIEINFYDGKFEGNYSQTKKKKIKKITSEFSSKYGDLFDTEDLEKIIKEFEKGTYSEPDRYPHYLRW